MRGVGVLGVLFPKNGLAQTFPDKVVILLTSVRKKTYFLD